jgi:hypothetical protein
MSVWKRGLIWLVKNTTDTILTEVGIIDGYHDVPAQDGSDNTVMRDIIGNRDDDHNTITLIGRGHKIDDHLHNTVFLYPELADGIVLTKASGVWAAYPTPTEIIPVNTITDDFDLHFLNVSDISANGEYAISVYKGAPGAEIRIGVFSASRSAVQSQEGTRPILSKLVGPNERISAAISSQNAALNTLIVKAEGHTY